ncbi:MAG: hypothetical protein HC810_01255 [Acaryochloridaceae cyanobacterium RL_2_7]|nr:hypothetical protein [Acaryochloridaceae cyanobacterium RL_2_7]
MAVKQLEEHLEKFALALSDKMDELGADLDIGDLEGVEALQAMEGGISPEEALEKSQEIEAWIKDYLKPYRKLDQEKLAIGLLNPIYDDIFDMAGQAESDDDLSLFMLNVMHGLSTFSMLKSFLSEKNLSTYAEPMRSLYTMLIDDMDEDAEEQKESLKTLFQPCLDVPEAKS